MGRWCVSSFAISMFLFASIYKRLLMTHAYFYLWHSNVLQVFSSWTLPAFKRWPLSSSVDELSANVFVFECFFFLLSWTHQLLFSDVLPGHGQCYCGNCYCAAGWHGDRCEFQCDISPWESRRRCTSPDGKICSNRGLLAPARTQTPAQDPNWSLISF